jgi:hypothetical protein
MLEPQTPSGSATHFIKQSVCLKLNGLKLFIKSSIVTLQIVSQCQTPVGHQTGMLPATISASNGNFLIEENPDMHRCLILLTVFALLFLPNQIFAQPGQPAAQKDADCEAAKVNVQVKLKNGDTINGTSIEINKQEVKLCRDGIVQTIPGEQIKEVKSRQTPGQRFKHAARVLGIAFGAILAFGFIRLAQEK